MTVITSEFLETHNQDQVVRWMRFKERDGLLTVPGNMRLVAEFCKHGNNQLLIHNIVLCNRGLWSQSDET